MKKSNIKRNKSFKTLFFVFRKNKTKPSKNIGPINNTPRRTSD